jgi:transcriptional regulator with GAF, ATPase, and Fis domain
MIRVFYPSGDGLRSRVFPDGSVLVGSSSEADLSLAFPGVAPRHFRVERVREGCQVVDLVTGSETRVNGVPVARKLLAPGDRIQAGEALIHFQQAPEDGGRAAAPDALQRMKDERRAGVRVDLEKKLLAVLEAYASLLGDDGLFEAEHVFQELLARRGISGQETLHDQNRRLLQLQKINKALASETNLKSMLSLIIDAAIELTRAERGFLVLLREEGRIHVEVARTVDQEEIQRPASKISRYIAEGVARSGEAILSVNAQEDTRFSGSVSVGDMKLLSILCVPLRLKDRVLGVLYLDNRVKHGVFTDKERVLLEMFADQAALALENARLHEALVQKNLELLRGKGMMEDWNRALARRIYPPGGAVETGAAPVARPGPRPEHRFDYSEIVGESPRMRELFQLLDRVIPTDAPVLIQGESGSGKELVARAIHRGSARASRPFVSENCAAIPDALMESELFGYKKGAFTGATANKPGLFEVAHGGTLFLDEVGELPLELQAKLLRALQEKEVRPVGAREPIVVDVRIVAATNRPLKRLVEERLFREDLYYRLNVFQVSVPPLRDRREDILLLADHFLSRCAAGTGGPQRTISGDALLSLLNYAWPGNVRELENEIRRASALADREIQPGHLSEEVRASRPSEPAPPPAAIRTLKEIVRDTTEEVEKKVILEALVRTGWKKTEAAAILGISRPTLDAKIEALGLRRDP